MMDTITSIANFSPKRQKSLEDHISEYPDTQKSKLLALCKTRWVERINALEVALELLEAVVDTFSDMAQNVDKDWNRDTVVQASCLLKSVDFQFIINLVLTQKLLAFTGGLTTQLQKRGIDLANVVNLDVRTLENVRTTVESFHHDCFKEACGLARRMDVDIERPRICKRQTFRQNAVATPVDESPDKVAQKHF
jgi:hypothetical protein